MKKLIIIPLLVSSFNLFAAQLNIAPLYSVETTRREYPAPAKQITKTFLGLSATYGVKLISAEFEVAQSTQTDSLPGSDSSVTITTQRAMLGARSTPFSSKYVDVFFRAGARAVQETYDIKQEGVKSTEKNPLRFDPYAGTGLSLNVANAIRVSAGATLVYNQGSDIPESQRYDTQYTLSASFNFGNR